MSQAFKYEKSDKPINLQNTYTGFGALSHAASVPRPLMCFLDTCYSWLDHPTMQQVAVNYKMTDQLTKFKFDRDNRLQFLRFPRGCDSFWLYSTNLWRTTIGEARHG